MPQPFHPERQTLGVLLSQGSLVVPDWQRSYSWDKPQVETFWKDVCSFSDQFPGDNVNDKEYFLGSIVLVDEVPTFQILDGQQRIATAAILLSVIRDSVGGYRESAATRLQSNYLVSFDDATDSSQDHLTLNVYDRDFFRSYILNERSASWSEPQAKYNSHEHIKGARTLLYSMFEAKRASLNDNEAFFRWCQRIRKVVTDHCSVVSVVSYDEESAAQVFETLNDRGINLSTADLLKNFLLRRAKSEQRDEINRLWGEMIEAASDIEVRQFLRHYWISTKGDIKTQGLYKEIKADIESNKIDSLVLTRKLRDAKETYDTIVLGQVEDPGLSELYKDVALLTAVALYPAILSAVEVWPAEVDKLKVFVAALITIFVRHNVVGGREASQFEKVAYDVAKGLRDEPGFDYRAKLQAVELSDDEFSTAFKELAPRKIAWARYLLATIEKSERPNEETILGPSAKLHVEHIYPQTPESKSEEWDDHEQWVGRLGNLTLLGRTRNTSLRNKPFAVKRLKYESSEIAMTRDLAAYENWTKATIEVRQEGLATKALSLWPTLN